MSKATAQKQFSCPACGAAAEWNPASQVHDYPNGITSSCLGLPSLRGYPEIPSRYVPQPLRSCINGEPNASTPLGLVNLSCELPRVARSSQPWADCSNPVGIHPDDNSIRFKGVGIHSDDRATNHQEAGTPNRRCTGFYPRDHATKSNPNGIGIIQPSVGAQRLRWVTVPTIHQL